jgi:hypothetical protein
MLGILIRLDEGFKENLGDQQGFFRRHSLNSFFFFCRFFNKLDSNGY